MQTILRVLAVVSAVVLMAGFVWYRTASAQPQTQEPGPSPSATPRVVMPGSKSGVVIPARPSQEPVLLPGSKSGVVIPATPSPDPVMMPGSKCAPLVPLSEPRSEVTPGSKSLILMPGSKSKPIHTP